MITKKCSFCIVHGILALVLAQLFLPSNSFSGGIEELGNSDETCCIIDVGDEGICLYGHWLSGKVEMRLEGCNVIIGGIMAFPAVPVTGVEGLHADCLEGMPEKAAGRYRMIKKVVGWGRLYMVFTGLTKNLSVETRYSEEFRVAVSEARTAKTPIEKSAWHHTVLGITEARQLQNPIPLEKCGGF